MGAFTGKTADSVAPALDFVSMTGDPFCDGLGLTVDPRVLAKNVTCSSSAILPCRSQTSTAICCGLEPRAAPPVH